MNYKSHKTTEMATIKNNKNVRRRLYKLGFEGLESALLVSKLNLLLANYAVHYQKLRNFHWNVVGPDFFDLHEKFEEQYNFTKQTIDTIAERVRVFGARPMSTLKEFLDASEINEVDHDFKSSMMVSEILNDFEIILTHLTDVYDTAAEIGDVGTSKITHGLIEELEKKFWMYSAFNTKEMPAEKALRQKSKASLI